MKVPKSIADDIVLLTQLRKQRKEAKKAEEKPKARVKKWMLANKKNVVVVRGKKATLVSDERKYLDKATIARAVGVSEADLLDMHHTTRMVHALSCEEK